MILSQVCCCQFGVVGECAGCGERVPAYQQVMRAGGRVFHLACFSCQQCGSRFCVGERYGGYYYVTLTGELQDLLLGGRPVLRLPLLPRHPRQ